MIAATVNARIRRSNEFQFRDGAGVTGSRAAHAA
jgi:hypothetical protein